MKYLKKNIYIQYIINYTKTNFGNRCFLILFCLFFISVHAGAQTNKLFTTNNGLSSSLVKYVFEDHYGLIWIATEDGLNKFDGVKITKYRHSNDNKSSLASNYVNTIIEDKNGNLIVSTYCGLQIYRHETDDFSPLATFSNGKTMRENISNMMLGKDSVLYGVGDMSCKIIALDSCNLEVRPMSYQYFSNKIVGDWPQELNVRATLSYDKNHLLLGTDGNGIKLFNINKFSYTDYPLNLPNIPQNLQKVHHMMRDKHGNLWIALYQKGVAMISHHKSLFGYIGSRISQQNLIGSHCIQTICRSKKGGMWIGTDGDGLYYLTNNNTQHIVDGMPPIINYVFEDSEGTLWIGSFGYPCYKYTNNIFEKVKGLPEQPQVFTIKEDRKQKVWLGTMGTGLYCYDLKQKKLSHIDDNNINHFINCIYVTSNDEILLGTFNGMYNINIQKQYCNKYIVYTIFEDSKRHIWLGTSEGLIKIGNGSNKVYTTKNGMPSNTVFAINEDEKGLLWFSSNAGLTCFDYRNEVFTNYSVNDGIQGNEFSKGAMIKDKDGTLWFAGHEGITYFLPSNISHYQYKLHPRITALYINNSPVTTATLTGSEHVLSNYIFDCKNFNIAYENNSFSIELSTKEINTPDKCSFLYSLDDKDWVSIPDGGHLISFSNLGAGTHSFRYLVEYNGKKSAIEEINITIRHPWWSSLWAKSLFILVIITIITLIFFWIRSREKVKILALISHKIRTPMSLIISPLTQLIDTDKDEERQKTYKLMLRNANKLQQLAAQATNEEPIGPISNNDNDIYNNANIQQSRTTKHIIIVEDDDDVRNYLCEQLSFDYHVHEATNGKEALNLIFDKIPDAVISDVTMPQMDGITLCKKIKKNIQIAHIPVILLTARADEESTLQGLGIGADAYITKPFNIKILRQKISNLILLRQQLRNTYQGQQLQENKLDDISTDDYDDIFMDRLMTVINNNIGDADFSIDMLCKEVGISRAGLHRKLKEKTNQSASIFIRNIRLKQSEKLLLETNLRINEIAQKVGFKQPSYYANSFKELYGITPNEWREQNKLTT